MSEIRIVVHPGIAYGRPCVAGKWVLTHVIYDRMMAEEPGYRIGEDYGLSDADLCEVMEFERWCRRRGRYDAPYAERLASHPVKARRAGGWPRQVWPRRASAGDAGAEREGRG